MRKLTKADGVISNEGFFAYRWLLAAFLDTDTRTMLGIILGGFAMRVMHLGVFVLPAWTSVRMAAFLEENDVFFSLRREFLLAGFVAYLVVLAAMTVVPLQHAAVSGHGVISLIPGHTTIGCYRQLTGAPVEVVICNMNLLGNIVLFIPMGILLPLTAPRFASARATVGTALLAAVAIEGIQYFQRSMGMGRSVDVDDVILNLVGAVIGYWLFGRYRAFRGKA